MEVSSVFQYMDLEFETVRASHPTSFYLQNFHLQTFHLRKCHSEDIHLCNPIQFMSLRSIQQIAPRYKVDDIGSSKFLNKLIPTSNSLCFSDLAFDLVYDRNSSELCND